MLKRAITFITVMAALAFVTASCSSNDTSSTPTSASAPEHAASGSIVVSAAASAAKALTTMRDDFATANPDANIIINFGSSAQLASQIQAGAPADVVAFADTAPMTALSASEKLAAAPKIFAANKLVIVTKPGNPKRISSLEDLQTAGIISLCAESAPCGKYAQQILANTNVRLSEQTITRGQDARATLNAVSVGDADAAIVYVTDARSANDAVETIAIPDAINVVARYPIAVLATKNRALARAFQEYVLSAAGQTALRAAGFLKP